MDDTLRRKLALLAERVEGKDISIIKEVRLDHFIEELSEVTRESLQQAISYVLSCPVDQVRLQLAKHENSDKLLDDLVKGLSKN